MDHAHPETDRRQIIKEKEIRFTIWLTVANV